MASGCGQNFGTGFGEIFSNQASRNQSDTGGIPSKGPTRKGHYRGIASGDLDGDGAAELISANILTGELVIWPGRKN